MSLIHCIEMISLWIDLGERERDRDQVIFEFRLSDFATTHAARLIYEICGIRLTVTVVPHFSSYSS